MDTIATDSKTVIKLKHNKKNDVRIAIVEDDPMYRSAIEYQLKKIPGSRLFSFGSGEECLRYYHLLDPEIMILDYRLNDISRSDKMNGLEILREVKSVKPETEIIFLSGQENLDVATMAMKGGASEYIFKDFNALSKLQNVVTRLSLFVRMKREKMNQAKWIFLFMLAIILILGLTSLSNYFHLSDEVNILYGSTAIALIVLFVIVQKKKKEKISESNHSSVNEHSEIWHD